MFCNNFLSASLVGVNVEYSLVCVCVTVCICLSQRATVHGTGRMDMPLELVTHTQTLIDSLWEINMATERASWIQTKQARHTDTTTATTIILGPKGALNIIQYVMKVSPFTHTQKHTQKLELYSEQLV